MPCGDRATSAGTSLPLKPEHGRQPNVNPVSMVGEYLPAYRGYLPSMPNPSRGSSSGVGILSWRINMPAYPTKRASWKKRRAYSRKKVISYVKRISKAPGCPKCGSPLKELKRGARFPFYLKCDGTAMVPPDEIEFGTDESWRCGFLVKKA